MWSKMRRAALLEARLTPGGARDLRGISISLRNIVTVQAPPLRRISSSVCAPQMYKKELHLFFGFENSTPPHFKVSGLASSRSAP